MRDEDTYLYRLRGAGLVTRQDGRILPAQQALCALLRRAEMSPQDRLRLQAGGTLNPRRHVYVRRPQDQRLLELLLAGEYVNILTSRQIGKSSLMVRTAAKRGARGMQDRR